MCISLSLSGNECSIMGYDADDVQATRKDSRNKTPTQSTEKRQDMKTVLFYLFGEPIRQTVRKKT